MYDVWHTWYIAIRSVREIQKLAKIVAWADAMCEALADSNLSPKSPESLDSIDPLING